MDNNIYSKVIIMACFAVIAIQVPTYFLQC